jgi:hypothetical protein
MKTLFTSLFVGLFAVATFGQASSDRGGYSTEPWSGSIADDGNNTLGQTYNSSQCGLNFTATSHMITTRYQTPGTGLPVNYNMQMPPCVGVNGQNVDKAYFWFGVSYNYPPNTTSSTTPGVSVTNPASQVNNFVGQLVGTSGPKCWGEQGTRTFRVDLTAAINGNGNYTINVTGIPAAEIDGGTLIIIYRDPAAAYTGTMIINDGCQTFSNGTPSTINCANFQACAAGVNGKGFAMTGDQQDNITPPSHQVSVGSATLTFNNDFWNYDVVNFNVAAGATSVAITNTPNPNDCWSYNVVGYYFQTSCQTCNPVSALQTSQSSTPAACGNSVGTASVSVSGGQPAYTYAWNTVPAQNGATATGLAAGTYTCNISDASGCNFAMEIVTVSGTPAVTASVTPAGPIQSCSGNPQVLQANLGAGYLYQWYDANGAVSGATSDNLSVPTSGNYYVIITDQFGCTATSNTVQVTQGVGPTITLSTTGGQCNAGVILVGWPGSPINICATAPGAVSYLWTPNGETTSCVTATAGGLYSVTAWDANGCASSGNDTITVVAVNVVCGHNGDKVILCHVPPGNPGNPQTICVAASAIPSHLANHPGDCVGPCSLYYAPRYSEVLGQIDEYGFFAEAYPNPSSNGFQLHMVLAPDVAVTVNVYDVTGRIVETYNNVTEQTILGAKLAEGMYAADVIQGDNHQMLHIVKAN